jgi:hypothetical protein
LKQPLLRNFCGTFYGNIHTSRKNAPNLFSCGQIKANPQDHTSESITCKTKRGPPMILIVCKIRLAVCSWKFAVKVSKPPKSAHAYVQSSTAKVSLNPLSLDLRFHLGNRVCIANITSSRKMILALPPLLH